MKSDNFNQILEDAWLNIKVNEHTLYNPLQDIPEYLQEEPHKFVLWLMQRPEYFYFLCKYVMGIDLLPFQAVILQILWKYKFPMLVGSRGCGKATPLYEPILTSKGWVKMGDIQLGDQVYGRDGKLHNVTHIHPQGQKQICRIKLLDGRTIDCCEDHLWIVKRQTKEITISTKDIINSGVSYSRERYKYKTPNCEPIQYNRKYLPIDPYILGCLLGDGGLSTLTPTVSSIDPFIINEFRKRLPGFKIELDPYTQCKYTIVDNEKCYVDCVSRRGNSFRSKCGNRLTNTLKSIGLNVTCKNKFIPDIYKYSSIEDRMELVRGLMDTDGCSNKTGSIEFTGVCERLVDDLVEVLRSLGIRCQKSEDKRAGQSYMLPQGRNAIRENYFRIFVNTSKPIFKLPRKLKRLKEKETNGEKYVSIVSAEYLDKKTEMQCITVDNPDHTYITKDHIVTHNSFLLALYALLRILLLPERRVVICGGSFRQSKVIFNYIETMWSNAPLLKNIVTEKSGPRHEPDMYRMHIDDSVAMALPLGTGEKIRGQRANDILSDEQACLAFDTYIQTDQGLIQIKDYLNGQAYQLLNIENNFEDPDCIFKTQMTDVYKVTTQNGYSFKCSNIHKVYTINGWKLAKDLTTNDFLEMDTNDYFPERYIDGLDEDVGWLMGLLVSEGTVTNRNYIRIDNTDQNLIELIKNRLYYYDWKEHYQDAYQDKRGWNCKPRYTLIYSSTEFRHKLYEFGLNYTTSHGKTIPKSILLSPKSVVIEFLRGLFIGDGSCFKYKDKYDKSKICVAYYSVSEELIDILQILLLKFRISCTKTKRTSKISNNRQWRLSINGENVKKIVELLNIKNWNEIIKDGDYGCKKPYIRKNGVGTFDTEQECIDAFNQYQKDRTFTFRVKSVEKLPEQEILYDFHMPRTNSFRGNGFIQHNSIPEEIFENVIAGFAAVKSSPAESVKAESQKRLRKKLGKELPHDGMPDVKFDNQIVLSGTSYYDFNHFARYWKRWRQIIRSKGDPNKLAEVFGGEGVPDDFNWKDYAIIRMPYNLLPKGFLDPAMVARSKATVHTGIFEMEFGACEHPDTEIITDRGIKYIKNIEIGDKVLTHKGRFKKVTKLYKRPHKNKICVLEFENNQPLRITHEHPILQQDGQFVPVRDIIDKTYTPFSSYYITEKYLEDYNGFVYNLEVEDDHSYSTPCCTVHNCFSTDSNGFFKRSLIESCVISKDNQVELPSGKVYFTPKLHGEKNKEYIFGIDPASEVDNFSIIVLEHYQDHRRIVHVWTTTKSEHRERIKAGLTQETDFYSYCARKIRDLMVLFPCVRIAMDAQGGGISICEALHDQDKIQQDELPIWPIIDPDNPADSDGEPGLHLVELIQFASSDWTSEANHGLRKDFEDKICLFPFFDSASLGLAQVEDNQGERLYDTLEDCFMEIEELKDELSTIIITQTPSGRDRWDTPEVKLPGNKKGRLRKDRYSALIMANMVSRQLARNPEKKFVTTTGGWANNTKSGDVRSDYIGADWIARGLNGVYD